MKFSCEKYVLQSAVATAARAAAAKSPIPTLEGLLIQAGAGVRITGYDLKKGIYSDIEADVAETGAAVFPAKMFSEMMRLLPDGVVTVVSGEDNSTKIKCGKSEYVFVSLSSDDYPELPAVDFDKCVSLPQKLLRRMIDETIFAVSTNESRPVYTGSLFEFSGGELAIVSVDGYRLAMRKEPLEQAPAEDMSFIIPGSALSDIERICADSDDAVQISVGIKHISFTIGGTVVVSRRLEGDFLNYRKTIPERFNAKIAVGRGEFLSAVDRVALMVDERVKTPLRLTFGDGRIDFVCMTPQGRADDVCVCEGGGGDTEIGFNDKYLRDALRAAPDDKLLCCINTGSSPCVFFPADESGKFAYMILPVRLRAGE